MQAKKDSSNNEKHGDGGRALEKAGKRVADLEKQLADTVGKKARQKILNKIQNIWKDARTKAKGETHHN